MALKEILEMQNSVKLAEMSHKVSCDFLSFTSNLNEWAGGAVNSGSYAAVTTQSSDKMGVFALYSHATNADSGYKILCHHEALILTGKAKASFIFATANTLTGVTMRIGFHNSISQNAPADGVYCSIIDGVIVGRCANNSVLSTTDTTFTLAANTWYRLKIELNADASEATFKLYADNSDTVVWADTLSANIPTTRTVGHGIIATIAAPTFATTLCNIDYMDMVLPNVRRA